jgi:hypothetical protein
MDIDKFCIDFFNKNKNSKTFSLVHAVVNAQSIKDKCRVVDKTVSWLSTSEGFYYFYFLQLRLALKLAIEFYKKDDFANAKVCYDVFRVIYRYTDYGFSLEKIGNTKIGKYRFSALKHHYRKMGQKFVDGICPKIVA